MSQAEHARWNTDQTQLRLALQAAAGRTASPDALPQALSLFHLQHSRVHPWVALPGEDLSPDPRPDFSLEDDLWDGLSEPAFRWLPPGGEHSIAWLLFHLTRIEDMTMNCLAAGQPQVYDTGSWHDRLGIPFTDTGNSHTHAEIAALSAGLNMAGLRAYRLAVSRATRTLAESLPAASLRARVEASRLLTLLDGGYVTPAAGLLDYWGGLTVAGLLLMPPTRHTFIHIKEAARIKARFRRPA